ncbi:MAG: DUF5665 domain-containing protein [Paracoccaceae bacterium]|jgi:hypothetical protein|nr:DUF5665 domain-containing protein [Paracoccaceae bacterium]MDP7185134.1 DUF5665 domain-containing protein [Paracoccaceae bacterium]
MTKDLQKDPIEQLTDEVRKLNSHNFIRVQNSLWRVLGYQFLRGLAFGLGTVLGASVLVSLLVWWLSQFEFLPIIGEWAAELVKQIESSP